MGVERVYTANDGDDALQRLESVAPELSVVLLDVMMTGPSVDLTRRRIRGRYPSLPVMLMSGFNEQQVMQVLAGSGHGSFLKKPFTIEGSSGGDDRGELNWALSQHCYADNSWESAPSRPRMILRKRLAKMVVHPGTA